MDGDPQSNIKSNPASVTKAVSAAIQAILEAHRAPDPLQIQVQNLALVAAYAPFLHGAWFSRAFLTCCDDLHDRFVTDATQFDALKMLISIFSAYCNMAGTFACVRLRLSI